MIKLRNIHTSLKTWLRAQNTNFGLASGAKTWFVDGVNGNDSYAGYDDPAAARATLGTVLGTSNAAASDGAGPYDVVYVADKGLSGTDPNPYQEASFNLSVRYANVGLAVIGIAHNAMPGRPWNPQVKGHSSATTAVLAIHAPGCAVENLAFNRGGSTTGGLAFYDEGDTTDQAQGSSVYNCYFRNVRGPNAAAGNGGGALFFKGGWNYFVERVFFYNCRHGIVAVSGSASTLQDLIVRDASFLCSAVTNVGVDIYTGMSGTASLSLQDIFMAHATPNLTSGDNRYIKITASEVGAIQRAYCGTASLTYGTAGTGIINPATVKICDVYSENALMTAA